MTFLPDCRGLQWFERPVWRCTCGVEGFANMRSIQPGELPIYAMGRDEKTGEQSKITPPILVKSERRSVCLCITCWEAKYARSR